MKETNRADRLNEGMKMSQSDLVLFHHPRALIPIDGIKYLSEDFTDAIWGGFTHSFEQHNPLLKFTSFYSNKVRFDLKGIVSSIFLIY